MPWPVHPTGFLGARGDSDTYRIERSLRFNSADSAYLNRTPSSAGNRKTWTWSGWVKLSSLVSQPIYLQYTNSQNQSQFGQNSSSKIRFYDLTSNVFTADIIWTPLYRDPSGWYNIMLSVDTTQATNTNRVKLFVNGIQVTQTDSATWPSQNSDLRINNNTVHYQGWSGGSDYVNGYLTEIYFIDGQALTPSSFGQTDPITGRWVAKEYNGTYGTNGFYLKFADNSGTTATTLGKDSSGNGNNWTPNNFSVTAGAGNDSLVDSPTNYGTDSYSTSVDNARGNYCTLNPVLSSSTISFSNGNLDATVGASGPLYRTAGGTIGVSSGKWYFESIAITPFANTFVGIGDISQSKSIWESDTTTNSNFWFINALNGNKVNGAGAGTSYGSAYSNGDIVNCAIDLDSGKIWWGKNGTWFASGDPASGTNAAFTNITGKTITPACSSGGATHTANFGQRPFAYAAPTGYKALCTTNLTTPTIKKPSTAMDVVTYTGDGSASRSITGLGFGPDFVWVKERGIAQDHALSDSVRGAGNLLFSNATAAEFTATTYGQITSFDNNGFTASKGSDPLSYFNKNTGTYVAWSWDAGSTTSTNTSGSITSTVSANTQAGFSIVSYTGTGANATVGHGLGVAPKMVIVKNRNNAGYNWRVYHSSLTTGSSYLSLNLTDASTSSTTIFTSTPSSSVFNIGSDNSVNGNSHLMIAYCFAEIEGYSKFGSYTGNGSSDGPFVWCGFRPKYVLIKRIDLTGNWCVHDSSRSQVNVMNEQLNPNLSNAESGTGGLIDFISNGFKIRATSTDLNGSAGSYIFSAFAEAPFKYARAR
jgi:SPRY domain